MCDLGSDQMDYDACYCIVLVECTVVTVMTAGVAVRRDLAGWESQRCALADLWLARWMLVPTPRDSALFSTGGRPVAGQDALDLVVTLCRREWE